MESFSELQLIEPLQRALSAEGYTKPTPIQAQTIPHLLAGRDVLGCAQTGTGKTAAFALPILQRLAHDRRPQQPRCSHVLVLAPTRELAIQIGESFNTYGRFLGLRCAVIFGGVPQNAQVRALARGVDILVATPGRLLDLLSQGHVRLDSTNVLVLDEADRMLDMGFINDVRKIVAAITGRRQTLLFAATMPTDVEHLASNLLNNPARVAVAPVSSTVDAIGQWVLFVERNDKRALLGEVLKDPAMERTLVFTRTKHGANKLVQHLDHLGVQAMAIHGNKSQSARQAALLSFREGRTRVLVATDVAARGIDVDKITHVVNFEMPNEPESYVHRIGRTGRAGATGVALSFCDTEERAYLRDIEKLTRRRLTVVEQHPYRSSLSPNSVVPPSAPRPRGNRPNGNRPNGYAGGGQRRERDHRRPGSSHNSSVSN